MVGLAKSAQYLWAVCIALECGLVILMFARQHYRNHPAFLFYLVVDIFQSVALFGIYQIRGFLSPSTLHFAWASQGVVICARALAVAELCRHLLREFQGIWALAWRLLLLCATSVALYSVLSTGWAWDLTVVRMNQGLELTMVIVIVVLFSFARYYEVVAEPALRVMAIGFFVLSCFKAVNDSILQHRLAGYTDLWRLLGMLAFLVSLSLWFRALYEFAPAPAGKSTMLPLGIYGSLAPKINERLRELNEQLKRFWHLKAQRS